MLRKLLAVALSASLTAGCVSVRVERARADAAEGSGALAVSVYEDESSRRSDTPLARPVYSELVELGTAPERVVARSLAPRWSVDALPPGRYRLDVTKTLDEAGNIVVLARPGHRVLEIAAGERVSASVVLKKVPVAWVVLAAVTVVVLVVLSIHWAKEGKLPVPPRIPLPPVNAFVAVDLAFAAGRTRGPEPAAVDVWPAPDSVVAARRVSVNFLLSAPLDPSSVGPGSVQALGTSSGEIRGVVSYLAREQLLRFTPSSDFAPGERVTVTLDLERVSTPGGKSGSTKTSTRFVVGAR